MVGNWAAAHVISRLIKWINIHQNFYSERLFVELADERQINYMVLSQGNTRIQF